MIYLGPDPRGGGFMATFAGRCGYQMAGRFARCRDPIVASSTACDYGHITVKLGWQPRSGAALVAGFTTG